MTNRDGFIACIADIAGMRLALVARGPLLHRRVDGPLT